MENENKEELTPKVDAPEVETPETTEKTPAACPLGHAHGDLACATNRGRLDC